MLDLSRQYAEVRAEVEEAVLAVCASQRYILGPEVTEFEKEAAAYLGVVHAIGCASGTDALWLALQSAGVGPGDEVITTPFSFFATASSIIRCGARPVFVDIHPGTLNIDPAAVEARLRSAYSSKFKAIMPVHLYGQCADMDALQRIAYDFEVRLIEDAAQAFGATWRGRHAGGLADLGGFSFYPSKNLSCYGDGGLVVTNNDRLAEQVKLLRNHGSRRRYYHEQVGWNSRLDSIQAAILRVNLRHLDDWNRKRKQRAAAYDLLLRSTGLLTPRNSDGMAPVRLLDQSSLA
jgi:dTDP-4-amino-4,6-dideoxygalactose transaminase